MRVDSGVADGSVVPPYYDSMVAKVIAHAPTRAEAVTALRTALASARLIGPTTNRDQLVNILADPEFVAGTVHTGFLDADPRATPITGDIAVAAVAVWFADHAREHAASPVLPGIPTGWRNNPAAGRTMTLRTGARTVTVADGPRRCGVTVDGAAIPISAVDVEPDDGDWVVVSVAAEVDGVRHRVAVTAVGDRRYVDGPDGHVVFERMPRHPDPDAIGHAGSLVATMPGAVRRVLVAAGDEVVAGQPVIVIEAMKMEHQITAPAAGRVADIVVTPGQQVDTGAAPAGAGRDERTLHRGTRPVRIANCSGFYGDRLSAAREMVEGGPIDVLTGDWLAELTMLILWKAKARTPTAATPPRSSPRWSRCSARASTAASRSSRNAGGLNPAGCADRVRELADAPGARRCGSPTSRATT